MKFKVELVFLNRKLKKIRYLFTAKNSLNFAIFSRGFGVLGFWGLRILVLP